MAWRQRYQKRNNKWLLTRPVCALVFQSNIEKSHAVCIIISLCDPTFELVRRNYGSYVYSIFAITNLHQVQYKMKFVYHIEINLSNTKILAKYIKPMMGFHLYNGVYNKDGVWQKVAPRNTNNFFAF